VRPVVAALAALVATGLVACGGGSPSTHDAFVSDAARICHHANERFADVTIVAPTAENAATALDEVIATGTGALRDLRALKPPPADQEAVGAWLGALDQALDEVGYTQDLLRQRRIGLALEAAVRADRLTRRAQTLARDVGLDRVCRVPRLIPPR
jgi:hypothetical protein